MIVEKKKKMIDKKKKKKKNVESQKYAFLEQLSLGKQSQ
jgi:hypothetical protein